MRRGTRVRVQANNTRPRRRSAQTWARLIEAWTKSGKTADEFAARRGIAPRTLTWWKWRLGTKPPPPAPAPLRLVPLQIDPSLPLAPASSAGATPAWELITARGHVLRVHREVDSAELRAVLAALALEEGRR